MKMLIDTFVNAVFLYDDKMVLIYNGFRGSDMDLASEPETCPIARSDVFL